MLLQHIGKNIYIYIYIVSVNIVIKLFSKLKKINIVINYWEYLVLNIVINCQEYLVLLGFYHGYEMDYEFDT